MFKFFLVLIFISFNLKAAPLESMVALVDEDIIFLSDLNDLKNSIKLEFNLQKASDEVLTKQALRKLIYQSLQLSLAKRYGIKVTDEEINKKLSSIAASKGMSISEFIAKENKLQKLEGLRQELKDKALMEQVQKIELFNQVSVTDADVQSFINKKLGNLGLEYKVSHIFLSGSKYSKEEMRVKAEEIINEYKKGGVFANLALRYSDGQEATVGGSLGWRDASSLPDVFLKALSRMKKSEISVPIELNNGMHLLKLDSIRKSKVSESVDNYQLEQIKLNLRLVKSQENFDLWLSRLASQAYIKIFLPIKLDSFPNAEYTQDG